jgi:hypothetical protein
MNRLSTVSRSLIVVSIAVGALLGFASLASATPPDLNPVSGDDRATAHPGNAKADDCSTLFPGSTEVAKSDITHTGDDNDASIDITAVADGVDVVGVVVKGGPAYNVYPADKLGDLPWLDLHAPQVPSGAPAGVSHWFVCGVEEGETTSSTPATTTTTEGEGSGGGGSTDEEETSTTTSSEEVSPAAEGEELASTGVNGGPLVALGFALLLGGGALLFLMRTRGVRR